MQKLEKFLLDHRLVVVFSIFILLSLLLTFPLIFKLNSEVPFGEGDTFHALAVIDSHAEVLEQHGFFQGLLLLIKTNQFNTFLPYAILAYLFGFIASYNIVLIGSFILSGAGTYFLAYYFTKNNAASILAGIIFAFSPFHFHQAEAAHIGTMQQQWLPFFVLYLFRFFDEFKFKHFILAGFFLFLIAITEHHLLAFTIVFIALFGIYKLCVDRKFLKNKRFWAYFATSLIFLAGTVYFLYAPLLKVANSSDNYLAPGIQRAAQYSMKFFDPLIHQSFNTWPSEIVEKIKDMLPAGSGRKSYYAGVTVLFITLLGLLRSIKIHKTEKLPNVGFWILVALIFYVAALGPYVRLSGEKVYLPYNLAYTYLPFFENIRATGRFFVYAMLGISILFSFGFAYAFKKYEWKKQSAIAFVVAALILLEFSAIPMATMKISYSEFYDELAKQQGSFKILEIPGSTSYAFANYKFITNNVHKKESIDGINIARKTEDFEFQKNTPVIRELLYTLPEGKNPEKRPAGYYDNANQILITHNIKYITVNKKFIKEDRFQKTIKFIEKYIQYESKYEDEYLIAYQIIE